MVTIDNRINPSLNSIEFELSMRLTEPVQLRVRIPVSTKQGDLGQPLSATFIKCHITLSGFLEWNKRKEGGLQGHSRVRRTASPVVSLKQEIRTPILLFVPYSTHQPDLATNNFNFKLGLSLPNAFPVDKWVGLTQANNNNQSLVATPQDENPSLWVLILKQGNALISLTMILLRVRVAKPD